MLCKEQPAGLVTTGCVYYQECALVPSQECWVEPTQVTTGCVYYQECALVPSQECWVEPTQVSLGE